MSNYSDALRRLSPIRPWMKQITPASARADALAGLTGATIVLPQGVAFALIAGLPPQYGLFTAMVVPIIAAIWGSSMMMVSGPTTAISAVIFATLVPLAEPGSADYIAIALTLTLLVGLMQISAGLFGLGELIAFISHSVIVGFTAAAALLIFVSQLGPALGQDSAGGGVLHRLAALHAARATIDITAIMIALSTIATIVILNRISRRLPSYVIALVVGALVSLALDADGKGIAHFSALQAVIPGFSAPDMRLDAIGSLLPGAAAVAFVGLLEAISIGKSFAARRGERLDSNQEIVGQGLSNAVGSLFQCYAGSGSFTRTGLNADCGAFSPLSAIFSSLFLLLMLLVLAPAVPYIPVPAMAGIILYVAWKLVNFSEIHHIITTSRSETIILAITFFTGVVSELDFAILIGVFTSLAVFLANSAHPLVAVGTTTEQNGRRVFVNAHHFKLPQCPQISMTKLEGPLFFGSIEHIDREFRRFEKLDGIKTRVLNLRGVGKIDMAGADFILDEVRQARAVGNDLHLVAKHPDILRLLDRLHCTEILGEEHIHGTKSDAIQAAVKKAKDEICANCTARIFDECSQKPGSQSSTEKPT